MKPQVFFADLRSRFNRNLLDKMSMLLNRVNLQDRVRDRDLVAIKLHFGEKGNTSFIQPVLLRRIVDQVKDCKGNPFLTDTNTLYTGSRSETLSHMTTAYRHGFVHSVVDAPILIADGLRGSSAVRVRIDKPLFHTVSIAQGIDAADVLLSVAHFKGHELSGFGGALKNLGMGCASREGKLSQHATLSPKVKRKSCTGCGNCLRRCPAGALSMIFVPWEGERQREVASIDPKQCIGCGECIHACPVQAVQIRWNGDAALFQRKMVEHAYGAVAKKKEKAVYLNALIQVTPACDCNPFSDTPIVPDIGLLASDDPVAIDQASADLVNGTEANRSSVLTRNWGPGEDKFRALYPEVDGTIQLAYGEEIGLGKRSYELVRI